MFCFLFILSPWNLKVIPVWLCLSCVILRGGTRERKGCRQTNDTANWKNTFYEFPSPSSFLFFLPFISLISPLFICIMEKTKEGVFIQNINCFYTQFLFFCTDEGKDNCPLTKFWYPWNLSSRNCLVWWRGDFSLESDRVQFEFWLCCFLPGDFGGDYLTFLIFSLLIYKWR